MPPQRRRRVRSARQRAYPASAFVANAVLTSLRLTALPRQLPRCRSDKRPLNRSKRSTRRSRQSPRKRLKPNWRQSTQRRLRSPKVTRPRRTLPLRRNLTQHSIALPRRRLHRSPQPHRSRTMHKRANAVRNARPSARRASAFAVAAVSTSPRRSRPPESLGKWSARRPLKPLRRQKSRKHQSLRAQPTQRAPTKP